MLLVNIGENPLKRIYIGILMLAGVLTLSACAPEPTHTPITKSVLATTPVKANASATRTLSGVLQSADQSVLSFEIPGVIERIPVNLGDTITKGQNLASIDDKVFRLAVEQRKGQLSETNARLTEARIDFERKNQLFARGAISKAEVDLAKSRFESLRDQVAIARTQVEIAQEDLDNTQLLAPFAGSVAIRHVEPSQQVSPSTPVLTIQGSNALEVAIFVPESMIGNIDSGDEADIEVLVDRQRQQFKGTVFEIGKQAQRANAFPVTVTLNVGAMITRLQAGMSAEISFTLPLLNMPENALQAPLSSIAAGTNDSHYVMALLPGEDNERFIVKRVPVEVLSMNAENATFISQEPLGQIVRTGIHFLREGQSVFIADGAIRTINE